MAKKREVTETQAEYVRRVKEQLIEALGASRLSVTQLKDILEDNYGFNINKGTLAKLFDINSPNIDFACLITACKFFGFDFKEFLEPDLQYGGKELFVHNAKIAEKIVEEKKQKETVKEHPFIESLQGSKGKFTILRDEGYIDDFKGFIMAPTKEGEMCEFDLTIYKNEEGITQAKFIRETNENNRFEYTGIPYYSKAYKVVLMFLTDVKAKGEFYFLSFGFQQYRTEEGLVFRQGLAVTGEIFGKGSIVSQNFVLLNTELSKEKMKYIPGLLKAPNNEFCVPAVTVEKLAKEHSEIQQLLTELSITMKRKRASVYIIDEDEILNVSGTKLSKHDKIKALLLLKGASLVADKYYYVADSKFSGFGKKYLADKDDKK